MRLRLDYWAERLESDKDYLRALAEALPPSAEEQSRESGTSPEEEAIRAIIDDEEIHYALLVYKPSELYRLVRRNLEEELPETINGILRIHDSEVLRKAEDDYRNSVEEWFQNNYHPTTINGRRLLPAPNGKATKTLMGKTVERKVESDDYQTLGPGGLQPPTEESWKFSERMYEQELSRIRNRLSGLGPKALVRWLIYGEDTPGTSHSMVREAR